MKTLVVYNNYGQLIFTQTNATEQYSCIVEDVTEDKEVIGVDVKTGKLILVDRLATHEEKELLRIELQNKIDELSDLSIENENNIDQIIDLKAENLLLKMEDL